MTLPIPHMRHPWSIVYMIVGATSLWFILTLFVQGFTEESIRMNIRSTARFSAICFCIAFSASAFHDIVTNSLSSWIKSHRKYFGISFAIIHLIHLGFLGLLHLCFYQVFVLRSPVELTLGGLAYVFIILMLLTSFDRFKKHISQNNWRRLHTIGSYWILIVFSNSIIGRVVGGKWEYLPLATLLVVVWIMRLYSVFSGKIRS